MLKLPDDVLKAISDVLHNCGLRLVCRRLSSILQHRHLSFVVNRSKVHFQMCRVQAFLSCVHTLNLACQCLGEEGLLELSPLKTAISLRSLTMNLHQNVLGDTGARALVEMLGGISRLQTLCLHLGNNAITDVGATALAQFRTLTALCSLTLSMWGNEVGDKGAMALARLHEAPMLRILILRLGCNGIGRNGALALSNVCSAPNLRFSLDLSFNPIRPDGDPQLQALVDANSMHEFSLYRCDLYSWDPDA
eukprot:EG_transcript_17228